MSSWFEHYHLSADPFSEDSPAWNFFYGGRYGIASLQLEQALERKRGLIVVTGPPGSGKSALVRNALGRMRVFAAATVSAAQAGPPSVIDVLLRSREPLDGGFSSTRKRAALIAMIEQARASQRAIVCVIEDAHHARPGQIKDLLAAIETAPNAASVFQVVLVGRSPLLDSLHARSLGDLRARTTATIETAPLAPGEVAEFLTERLECANAPVPDALLPAAAMAAIAHHSGGVAGLAAALARSALERAAESGDDTVTAQLVEEIATAADHAEQEAAEPHAHRFTARAFGLGAVAALVLLAFVVAAAEVQLLGSNGRRIRANVDALRSLAGFGENDGAPDGSKQARRGALMSPFDAEASMSEDELVMPISYTSTELRLPLSLKPSPPMSLLRYAQLGTPREEFLGDYKKHGSDASSKPYEVEIKPPQRPVEQTVPAAPAPRPPDHAPGSAPKAPQPGTMRPRAGTWSETHVEAPTTSGETVITVPGIPGPLPPVDPRKAPIVRPAPEIPVSPPSPPATDTAAVRHAAPELDVGPFVALQVGAFRERSSADALKAKLSGKFDDVYVSTVDSGGEPLYRVRVGKFKSAEDTASLRDRLQAAGHASFRVNEP